MWRLWCVLRRRHGWRPREGGGAPGFDLQCGWCGQTVVYNFEMLDLPLILSFGPE